MRCRCGAAALAASNGAAAWVVIRARGQAALVSTVLISDTEPHFTVLPYKGSKVKVCIPDMAQNGSEWSNPAGPFTFNDFNNLAVNGQMGQCF